MKRVKRYLGGVICCGPHQVLIYGTLELHALSIFWGLTREGRWLGATGHQGDQSMGSTTSTGYCTSGNVDGHIDGSMYLGYHSYIAIGR